MWELMGPIVAAAMKRLGVKPEPKETLPLSYFEELEELEVLHSVTPIKSDLPQILKPASEDTGPNTNSPNN
jgi:hypothetical protein